MAFLIVTMVSILVMALGVLGLASPAAMMAFVSRWESRTGLWVAAIVRVIFGVALWFAAPASRAAGVLRVLAVVSVAAACVLPLLGVSRVQSILVWWSRRSPAFVRTWSAAAFVCGAFLLWSVVG